MAELGWLHQLAQKYEPKGLRIVSLSFDESEKDAEEALRRVVKPDPITTELRKLGVSFEDEQARGRGALLAGLRNLGIHIDGPAAERAVLELLAKLGVDPDRRRVRRTPVEMAFGKSALLHVVPADLKPLYFKAVGEQGLPQMFVIDQRGVLRRHGHVFQEELEGVVSSLLEAPPDRRATDSIP